MRPVLIVALSLTALLAACSEQPAAPGADLDTPTAAFYVGTWAADPAWCTDQSVGFPITIEADTFNGRENVCDMAAITETPEGGWTAQLTCQSEGAIVEESIVFSPAGEQLAIVWPDRDTETTLFSRCD